MTDTILLEAPPTCSPAPVRPDFVRQSVRPPLVTVAVPAYNRPALLSEALKSIAAQRDFDDFEVVVCDDGGLAETRRVVEECPLPLVRFYVNRPGLGAVGNWNRCLALASGRWVTLLHEDDTLYPWFLATVVPRLRAGVAAVALRCAQAGAPPAVAAPVRVPAPRAYAPAWFLKSSMTPFPGVVFSRTLATTLGGFDHRQGGLADYAFWYALACTGPVEVLPTVGAFYRVLPGQWTEREWPAMLRRAHLLRLRVAREQLPSRPGLGRWLARFFTARMARSYARRFAGRPVVLSRALRLQRAPLGWLPSGWVWKLLQLLPRLTSETR